MAMIARYQMADEKKLYELLNKNSEELLEEVEALQETDEIIADIDKGWDGLHFLLNKVDSSMPIWSNPLSQAIVGTYRFCADEDSDFISCIAPKFVPDIFVSLKNFDIEDALSKFEPSKFKKNDIYPDIWYEEDKEELKAELNEYFNILLNFYEKAAELGKGVIVSIY